MMHDAGSHLRDPARPAKISISIADIPLAFEVRAARARVDRFDFRGGRRRRLQWCRHLHSLFLSRRWAGVHPPLVGHHQRGRRPDQPFTAAAEPVRPPAPAAPQAYSASFLASLASFHTSKGPSPRIRHDGIGISRCRATSWSARAPRRRPPGASAPAGAPRQQRERVCRHTVTVGE